MPHPVYRFYDEADLVTTFKINRLRWAGHVMRMQDNLPCKKITLDKPEGRRWAGRPNLRWIDGVTKDAEKLGIRNWRTRTRDRDGWRRLLEVAKPCMGCSACEWMTELYLATNINANWLWSLFVHVDHSPSTFIRQRATTFTAVWFADRTWTNNNKRYT
jgi:hypothetical protein